MYLLLLSAIILVLLSVIGLLFRDNDTLGGFISADAEIEYKMVYDEALIVLPERTDEQWINTEFGTVRVYKFAEKETEGKTPLLLLPGKSASTPMWQPNVRDLMKERLVYTVDLLGEPGLSVQRKKITTAEDQAVWLHEVIESLPENLFHLIGHSFGGWNAANAALFNSNKIESLSLVDPVYVFGPIPLKMILASIPASVPFVSRSIREKMLSYIAGGAEADEREPIAKLIETGMRTFKSRLPMPAEITPEKLQKIELPVLGILAENSTMHRSNKAMQVGEKNLVNPLSRMVMFPDASHAINGEYPKELAKTVLDFVNEVDNSSSSIDQAR
ncbi:MAG: alpha/beta fold hydrolase [Candidatus Pristimantibacillus sp.]